MQSEIVEIVFQVREPGATGLFWGISLGIQEVLLIEWEDGHWKVTNPEGHPSWVGRHESQHGAICEYLKARLDIPPVTPEASEWLASKEPLFRASFDEHGTFTEPHRIEDDDDRKWRK